MQDLNPASSYSFNQEYIMHTAKYGRTYHYPFSPGTTSDDRVQHNYWQHIISMPAVLHTEKLDGENNCLNRYGVFARSHAAPATSPWTAAIRQRWSMMQHDLGDLEIFGENLYAIHSIEYRKLEEHYFVFGIRCLDMWLSWDEVRFYAAAFDLPTVPGLDLTDDFNSEADFRNRVLALSREPGVFRSHDIKTGQPCTREGIVSRNIAAYPVTDLATNVFKYVRRGHVATDSHWTRNWRRARLVHEQIDQPWNS